MAEDNRKKEHSALSSAASAAGTAKSALKTGKAVAGAAKGAAAGPYGMLAAGLWENRKVIGKVLAAFAALLMLPVLFILMLPSLIFGSLGLDDATGDALNDNSVIMEKHLSKPSCGRNMTHCWMIYSGKRTPSAPAASTASRMTFQTASSMKAHWSSPSSAPPRRTTGR